LAALDARRVRRGHPLPIRGWLENSAIWNEWLPAHDRRAANGPSIERHLETFDTRIGLGGVEIWIALEDAGS
jgi:hypothetical protein